MEGYVQMTLNDWVEMKQKLRRELLGVKQSFVRIGYVLRQIEDGKLYEQDGYKGIAEFAKAEYGLEASTVSRFMSINREYSIDGYSEHLRPEYAELGRSQLEEMLKLPDADRQMIGPETQREDIRDLKRFNKAEPEEGVADDLRQLVEMFFRDNPDALNEMFSLSEEDRRDPKRISEAVNPGGNKSYRKGLYFLMMYENRISIKKFGSVPQEMTWEEFGQIMEEIFGEAAAGKNTWKNYFGATETEQSEEPAVEQPEAPENTEKTEIAPAQKEPEPEKKKEEPEQKKQTMEQAKKTMEQDPEEEMIPGQANIEDYPEYLPEGCEADHKEQAVVEQSEEPAVEQSTMEQSTVEQHQDGKTRKEYLDSLTASEAARYLHEEYKRKNFRYSFLEDTEELQKWLEQDVDGQGREIVDVEGGVDDGDTVRE